MGPRLAWPHDGFHVGRCGPVCACAAWSAAPSPLLRSLDLSGAGVHPVFHGDGCGGVRRCFWGKQEGLGNLEPGRVFRGRGVFRVPQCVSGLVLPSVCLLVRSRAVVFLTSLSCLVEGVRSGTRRRRRASASAQAGGGPGRNRGAGPSARRVSCECPEVMASWIEVCVISLPEDVRPYIRLRARVTLPSESAAISQAPRLLSVRSLSSNTPFPFS